LLTIIFSYALQETKNIYCKKQYTSVNHQQKFIQLNYTGNNKQIVANKNTSIKFEALFFDG